MSISIFLTNDRKITYKIKTVLDFTFIQSLDSPASAVKMSYFTENSMGRILSITVKQGSKTLFYGDIDRHVIEQTSRMEKHTLEARDAGAMLLDQEAKPAKYKNLDFKQICATYIPPNWGLGNGILENKYVGEFTVLKGQRVWDVVNNFCTQAFKTKPFLYQNNISTRLPTIKKFIKNPILSLALEQKPCEKIGKIFIRDKSGGYSGCVCNPFDYGCKRNTYYIPTNEWEHASESAENIIKSSMRKSENITIKFDGIVDICAGESFEFIAKGKEYKGLTAFEVNIKGDRGFTTTIKAIRTCYL